MDTIETESARSAFVLIDLGGTASIMVANVIGMSDSVVITLEGSSMDAKCGAKILRLIASQARLARRQIPHAVVLTPTSAVVRSRSLKNVTSELTQAGVPVFDTAIVERAVYRDHFVFGGTLSTLDSAQTSNVQNAIENARDFAGELVARVRETVQ